MLSRQVLVNRTGSASFPTEEAPMSLAVFDGTCHMIATVRLLSGNTTARTVLDLIRPYRLPSLQESLTFLLLLMTVLADPISNLSMCTSSAYSLNIRFRKPASHAPCRYPLS